MIDLTQQMMDLMAVYLGMGFTPFDPQNGRVCGDLDPFMRSGLLDGAKRFSIFEFDQYCLATGAVGSDSSNCSSPSSPVNDVTR